MLLKVWLSSAMVWFGTSYLDFQKSVSAVSAALPVVLLCRESGLLNRGKLALGLRKEGKELLKC